MKQVSIAEDILESIQLENGAMFSSYISPHGNIAEIVNKAMIEFAKLHVEAALKAASDVAFSDSKYDVENSYPLENIH